MDIKPVVSSGRNLKGVDYFLFWAGVAISLAEIWAGGFLAPMGFCLGLLAIFLGHIIGNTFLALGGVIGAEYGITSMGSVRPSFGIKGANIAAILNIIQLIGWASILLIIAGQAGAILGSSIGGIWASSRFWTILIGAGTLFWALCTGEKIWKIMQYTACITMLAVILIMTWVVFGKADLNTLSIPATGSMHFMSAVDLVIAMPISFLPIVADYSRFSKSKKTSFLNTWFGYFLVSSWMYVLGLTAAIVIGERDPAILMVNTLSIIGLAVPALIMVVFSTITSNFPDLYSATCSMMNISKKTNPKLFMWFIALLTILVALVFPMGQYENYLLFIGAMFIPLFGVVLTDYFIIRKRKLQIDDIDSRSGVYWYTKGVNIIALTAWGIGLCVYFYFAYMNKIYGGSLPSIIIAGLLYYIFMKLFSVKK